MQPERKTQLGKAKLGCKTGYNLILMLKQQTSQVIFCTYGKAESSQEVKHKKQESTNPNEKYLNNKDHIYREKFEYGTLDRKSD